MSNKYPPATDLQGVKRVYKALVEAGFGIDTQDCDTGKRIKGDKATVIAEATAADDGYFIVTKDGDDFGWIWFVYGNDPGEVVCDHTTNLSFVIDPLTENWL